MISRLFVSEHRCCWTICDHQNAWNFVFGNSIRYSKFIYACGILYFTKGSVIICVLSCITHRVLVEWWVMENRTSKYVPLLTLDWYWDCSRLWFLLWRWERLFYIYQELSYRNKTMKEITKLAGQNVQALVSFTNTYTYITFAGHVFTIPTSLESWSS